MIETIDIIPGARIFPIDCGVIRLDVPCHVVDGAEDVPVTWRGKTSSLVLVKMDDGDEYVVFSKSIAATHHKED